MPRSRSRSSSPYRKTEKSRRPKKSHTKSRERSPSDTYRKSSRRLSRSPSKSKKNRRYRSAERRHRRSRSTSSKHRRQSRSPSYTKHTSGSGKYYSSSSRRKSRSRDDSSRPSKHSSRRRASTSSSSSNTTSRSSRSDTPAEERFIPLTKVKELKHVKTPPPPPVGIFDSVNMLLDEPVMPETLDLINADEFVAKSFTSNKKVLNKVVIDLTDETISVPVAADTVDEDDSIFHPNLYTDDSLRMEKWVKKLYIYRQKMFYGN